MLERNNGIRDMEDLLQISRRCVLNTLCRAGKQIVITPSRLTYSSIQLDELWSYVGRRKKGKYWLLYACSSENDEILAFVCGSRSSATVRKLLKQLEYLQTGKYCTDSWRSFKEVLPTEKHKIGKDYTSNIEWVNTCIRARNRSFVRRTTCFSKKKKPQGQLKYHYQLQK